MALNCCEATLYYLVNFVFFFITIWAGIYKVEPMQATIFKVFGKVTEVQHEQGIHWVAPICVKRERVSL